MLVLRVRRSASVEAMFSTVFLFVKTSILASLINVDNRVFAFYILLILGIVVPYNLWFDENVQINHCVCMYVCVCVWLSWFYCYQ